MEAVIKSIVDISLSVAVLVIVLYVSYSFIKNMTEAIVKTNSELLKMLEKNTEAMEKLNRTLEIMEENIMKEIVSVKEEISLIKQKIKYKL
jgi:ABC-type lipoprotein release transport system permease subunit